MSKLLTIYAQIFFGVYFMLLSQIVPALKQYESQNNIPGAPTVAIVATAQ
jgi:hypothetical protein